MDGNCREQGWEGLVYFCTPGLVFTWGSSTSELHRPKASQTWEAARAVPGIGWSLTLPLMPGASPWKIIHSSMELMLNLMLLMIVSQSILHMNPPVLKSQPCPTDIKWVLWTTVLRHAQKRVSNINSTKHIGNWYIHNLTIAFNPLVNCLFLSHEPNAKRKFYSSQVSPLPFCVSHIASFKATVNMPQAMRHQQLSIHCVLCNSPPECKNKVKAHNQTWCHSIVLFTVYFVMTMLY